MRRFTTLTGLFLIAIGISSCFKDGTLNLNNGLVFNVNAKLLPAPLTISFVNAAPSQTAIPANIYLDFFGEGAGNLYTPTGSSNLVVVEGLVNIGIKDGVKPTAASPLRFGVDVSAPGFFPGKYFVSVNNLDIPQYVVIYLVEDGNYPSGVSGAKEVHQVSSTGFSNIQHIQTPLSGGKMERVSTRIETGTRIFTPENSLVTGNVQVSMVHYDNRSPISQRTIAGLTESIPATDLNGADLGEVTFFPAGFYTLGMNAGSVEGDHFSQPLQMTLSLNPQTFNPATGQYIAPGDELNYWRFDAAANRWIQMGSAVVETSANLLQVVFPQSHAGTWLVGQAVDLCKVGATLTVRSGIPENACGRNFFTTLIDINTGRPLSAKWSNNYLDLSDKTKITLTNVPEGAIAKLQVWEGVRGCEGLLLEESQPFQACASTNVSLDLSGLNTAGWLPLSVSVSGYCEVNGARAVLMPSNCLMYRPAGCGVYGMLADLKDGGGCIATLEPGLTYDFKTMIGEQVYEFMHIPLEAGVISYPLPNGEVATIRIETSPGAAKLTLEGLPLPDDFCDLIEE